MLKHLRIQLTLLFLSAGILLVASIGAILYLRLESFFKTSTDTALKYRLALELRNLQAPVSPELEAAEQDFLSRLSIQNRLTTPTLKDELEEKNEISPSPTELPSLTPSFAPATPIPVRKPAKSPDPEPEEEHEEEDGEEKEGTSFLLPATVIYPVRGLAVPVKRQVQSNTPTNAPSVVASAIPHPEEEIDQEFDSELAAIFVNHIDLSAGLVNTTSSGRSPYQPEVTSLLAAQKSGMDLRTVVMPDGTPVRYLSYKLPDGFPSGYVQLGRKIDDQKRLLNEYLMNMGMVGLVVLVILGIGSWWIAGRAVVPTQRSLDQQQSFIANASHELRSPLTLIRATTELASRKAAPGEAKKLMGEVLNDVDYMSKLVEDLLILSRLDNQKLVITLKQVSVDDLFTDLQRQFNAIPSGDATRLVVQPFQGNIQADPDRMRQLLWILIDNAIQHTPVGSTVMLSARESGDKISLMVNDNGTGIPKEDIPYVFERFFKGRNAKPKSKGAGLGLAIARSLAESQNCAIQLDSLAGKGTRVTVTVNKS